MTFLLGILGYWALNMCTAAPLDSPNTYKGEIYLSMNKFTYHLTQDEHSGGGQKPGEISDIPIEKVNEILYRKRKEKKKEKRSTLEKEVKEEKKKWKGDEGDIVLK